MKTWPLRVSIFNRILPDEPGKFGTVRSTDVHTGVDLYCERGTIVQAVEDGVVVAIEPFTGEWCPEPDTSPWWNNTAVIMVEDSTGVWAYGEVAPDSIRVKVGDRVLVGEELARIDVPVLKTFKGRPMVMLHFERYNNAPPTGASRTVWWKLGEPKPERLLDPSEELYAHSVGVFDLKTYDGVSYVDLSAPRKDSAYWEVWGGKP